jgi:Leucine-rich repeat (LRR) protein
METLSLANTSLSRLTPELFTYNEQMTELTISFNPRLEFIPFDAFWKLPNLKKLTCFHNTLTDVSVK